MFDGLFAALGSCDIGLQALRRGSMLALRANLVQWGHDAAPIMQASCIETPS